MVMIKNSADKAASRLKARDILKDVRKVYAHLVERADFNLAVWSKGSAVAHSQADLSRYGAEELLSALGEDAAAGVVAELEAATAGLSNTELVDFWFDVEGADGEDGEFVEPELTTYKDYMKDFANTDLFRGQRIRLCLHLFLFMALHKSTLAACFRDGRDDGLRRRIFEHLAAYPVGDGQNAGIDPHSLGAMGHFGAFSRFWFQDRLKGVLEKGVGEGCVDEGLRALPPACGGIIEHGYAASGWVDYRYVRYGIEDLREEDARWRKVLLDYLELLLTFSGKGCSVGGRFAAPVEMAESAMMLLSISAGGAFMGVPSMEGVKGALAVPRGAWRVSSYNTGGGAEDKLENDLVSFVWQAARQGYEADEIERVVRSSYDAVRPYWRKGQPVAHALSVIPYVGEEVEPRLVLARVAERAMDKGVGLTAELSRYDDEESARGFDVLCSMLLGDAMLDDKKRRRAFLTIVSSMAGLVSPLPLHNRCDGKIKERGQPLKVLYSLEKWMSDSSFFYEMMYNNERSQDWIFGGGRGFGLFCRDAVCRRARDVGRFNGAGAPLSKVAAFFEEMSSEPCNSYDMFKLRLADGITFFDDEERETPSRQFGLGDEEVAVARVAEELLEQNGMACFDGIKSCYVSAASRRSWVMARLLDRICEVAAAEGMDEAVREGRVCCAFLAELMDDVEAAAYENQDDGWESFEYFCDMTGADRRYAEWLNLRRCANADEDVQFSF